VAYDALLKTTGQANTDSSDGRMTIASSGGSAAGIFVGKGRNILAELRIGGAVVGTNPTLDIKFTQSDTLGGSYTDIGAAFPQRTASDVVLAGGAANTGPNRLVFSPTKDYIKAAWTIGGTGGPSFPLVSIELLPVEGSVPL
jgi:hypothetical protein